LRWHTRRRGLGRDWSCCFERQRRRGFALEEIEHRAADAMEIGQNGSSTLSPTG